jgi:hypothetical protein
MQTNEVWHYLQNAVAVAKQFSGRFAIFASGFTAKELFSFCSRKIHVWLELRRDNKVVAYLIREFEADPRTPPDSYNQSAEPYYRSSRQIADAVKAKSVDTIQRLERMEKEERVKRRAPKPDLWTVTENEYWDYMRRHRRPIDTLPP